MIGFFQCIFLMILNFFTYTEFTICWTCMVTTCSPRDFWNFDDDFFTPCVTGFIDDLFNDSSRDTLVWNAVINFHCLFQDLKYGHFHDLF